MAEETLSAFEVETPPIGKDETLLAVEDEILSAVEDETLSVIEDYACNPVTKSTESSTVEGKLLDTFLFNTYGCDRLQM